MLHVDKTDLQFTAAVDLLHEIHCIETVIQQVYSKSPAKPCNVVCAGVCLFENIS
jgi:hypothetical protein